MKIKFIDDIQNLLNELFFNDDKKTLKIKLFDNDDELNKIKNYYLSKKIQILKPLKIIKFNILKI